MRRESKLYLELWAAVLEKALEDLNHNPPETREDLTMYENSKVDQKLHWKRQAQAWFKSEDKGFNSFDGVCLILGLEASEIRKRLHKKGLL